MLRGDCFASAAPPPGGCWDHECLFFPPLALDTCRSFKGRPSHVGVRRLNQCLLTCSRVSRAERQGAPWPRCKQMVRNSRRLSGKSWCSWAATSWLYKCKQVIKLLLFNLFWSWLWVYFCFDGESAKVTLTLVRVYWPESALLKWKCWSTGGFHPWVTFVVKSHIDILILQNNQSAMTSAATCWSVSCWIVDCCVKPSAGSLMNWNLKEPESPLDSGLNFLKAEICCKERGETFKHKKMTTEIPQINRFNDSCETLRWGPSSLHESELI